jgi:hypothetical protein
MESAMAKKKSIPRRLMADSRTTAQRFDSLLNPTTEGDGCCIIPSILLQKAPAGTHQQRSSPTAAQATK